MPNPIVGARPKRRPARRCRILRVHVASRMVNKNPTMKPNDGLKEVSDMKCPQCESTIELLKDLQNHHTTRRGDIVICWNCAAIARVGDSSLVPFNKSDFAKLDEASKNRIAMTVTSILKRNAQESNQ